MERKVRLRAALAFLPMALGGCASGESHLEAMMKGIHPADGLVVAGALWLAGSYAQSWSEQVVDQGGGRYHVEVARSQWSGSGEGDFGRRFNAVGARTCGGFRLVSYSERFEPEKYAQARRIAEGVIECDKP